MGSLVIAKVGKQFFRVRIYERDSIGKACVVVSLEDASFVEVPFENLYKLEKEFADPPGQVIFSLLISLLLPMRACNLLQFLISGSKMLPRWL